MTGCMLPVQLIPGNGRTGPGIDKRMLPLHIERARPNATVPSSGTPQ